jgi:hypothetical protein
VAFARLALGLTVLRALAVELARRAAEVLVADFTRAFALRGEAVLAAGIGRRSPLFWLVIKDRGFALSTLDAELSSEQVFVTRCHKIVTPHLITTQKPISGLGYLRASL